MSLDSQWHESKALATLMAEVERDIQTFIDNNVDDFDFDIEETKVRFNMDNGFGYECCDCSMEVIVSFFRWETEDEVEARLARNEKARHRREYDSIGREVKSINKTVRELGKHDGMETVIDELKRKRKNLQSKASHLRTAWGF